MLPSRHVEHAGAAEILTPENRNVAALQFAAPRDWSSVVAAYLAEVGQRTGSARTPAEYRR